MAYEVIKRVSGRAYRYRVESYRDPETRRVRGKWTYLGRVEGEGTLSPERKARPSSRERLLDAVERLLETNELSTISTGMVASEAGLAYGTFYRHFRDLAHVVRDAMVRETANLEKLNERFAEAVGDTGTERAKARLVGSRSDRRRAVAPGTLPRVARHEQPRLGRRRRTATPFRSERRCTWRAISNVFTRAGTAKSTPAFAAYAIIALVGAAAREAAIDKAFSEAKHEGIISVVTDLAGAYSTSSIGWWRMSHSTSVAPNGVNPAFA